MAFGYWFLVFAGLLTLVIGLDQLFLWWADRGDPDDETRRYDERVRAFRRDLGPKRSRFYHYDDTDEAQK